MKTITKKTKITENKIKNRRQNKIKERNETKRKKTTKESKKKKPKNGIKQYEQKGAKSKTKMEIKRRKRSIKQNLYFVLCAPNFRSLFEDLVYHPLRYIKIRRSS